MNEQTLRALIQTRIGSGVLPPHAGSLRLIGGAGDNVSCDCCGSKITATQVQYDFECLTSMARMHRDCYLIWRTEPVRGAAPTHRSS